MNQNMDISHYKASNDLPAKTVIWKHSFSKPKSIFKLNLNSSKE